MKDQPGHELEEFMSSAYALLVEHGWVDFWPAMPTDEIRSVEMTHPEHCPHDPVSVHFAFAIMFAAAGAIHRDRVQAS